MSKNNSQKRNTAKYDYFFQDSIEIIPKKKRTKQKGHYRWTLSENIAYCQCLAESIQNFESQFNRRSSRVFRKISALLKNRTPDQCRSHHQKMIKSYSNIEGIIKNFKKVVQMGQNNSKSIIQECSQPNSRSEQTNQFSNQMLKIQCQQKQDLQQQTVKNKTIINDNLKFIWDDVFNF